MTKAALRKDFADRRCWGRLARARGVKLPPWNTRATPGGLERWVRRLGWRTPEYLVCTGHRQLKEVCAAMPSWPLRAHVGLMLEWVKERR